MSETLVTRMANAIRDAATAAANDPVGKTWEEIALAALRAIREPTEGMIDVGLGLVEDRTTGTVYGDASLACWIAMIDAAIAEAGAQE